MPRGVPNRKPGTKKICAATKRNGDPCGREAGWGTDHLGHGRCKFHSGATPRGAVAAAKEEAGEMAKSLPVTPGQAVLGVLHLGTGQLAYVTAKVAELDEKEMFEKGLTGEQPSRWLRLQRDLMDRVSRYAKLAGDMGIAERQIALAEQQTAMMKELLEGVMGEVGLTAAQRKKVGPAIRKHLSLVEGKAREVVDA